MHDCILSLYVSYYIASVFTITFPLHAHRMLFSPFFVLCFAVKPCTFLALQMALCIRTRLRRFLNSKRFSSTSTWSMWNQHSKPSLPTWSRKASWAYHCPCVLAPLLSLRRYVSGVDLLTFFTLQYVMQCDDTLGASQRPYHYQLVFVPFCAFWLLYYCRPWKCQLFRWYQTERSRVESRKSQSKSQGTLWWTWWRRRNPYHACWRWFTKNLLLNQVGLHPVIWWKRPFVSIWLPPWGKCWKQ